MYSLETLCALNKSEEKKYFQLHPLAPVTCPDDVRKAPDYSGGSTEKICSVFRVRLHERFFVDSSGFGSPSEPAYTYPAFRGIVERILKENPNRCYYAALTGVGQFQVYVSLFYKEKRGKR